jgi:hypothetical protein
MYISPFADPRTDHVFMFLASDRDQLAPRGHPQESVRDFKSGKTHIFT